MTDREVVVIGAGSAGIAAALVLKDAALRPLVLDRATQVGSSWRTRYDRLRLNTCRPFSHLPNRPFPKGTPMFPSRDELIAHLERHADEPGIDLQLGTRVDRIDRHDGEWLVRTSADDRSPTTSPSAGPRRGMALGTNSSNVLLRAGPGGLPGDMLGVLLLRFPPRIGDTVARFGRGMDIGDLTAYGLPVPDEGVFTRMRRLGVAPTIVDNEAIEAVRAGRIEVVRGVDSLDATGVRLAGGSRVEPDAVICATGYRRGLDRLVGHVDVLAERGVPRALGSDPAAPGLRFIGYVPRPGGLGYMAKEAKRAAKAIAGEFREMRRTRRPELRLVRSGTAWRLGI